MAQVLELQVLGLMQVFLRKVAHISISHDSGKCLGMSPHSFLETECSRNRATPPSSILKIKATGRRVPFRNPIATVIRKKDPVIQNGTKKKASKIELAFCYQCRLGAHRGHSFVCYLRSALSACRVATSLRGRRIRCSARLDVA